ncbi:MULTISPECIES: hypothetical protein [Lactococcus]|uniref:hypothetical protein n=1 Tax=Lactococcus TaxID=1357 RepID=UPI0007AE5C97|nr:hypothetical protein [Lactococcus cremoris]
MLVWRRKGLLVVLSYIFGIVLWFGVGVFLGPVLGEKSHTFAILDGSLLLIPAFFNFVFCKYFLKDETEKVLTDEKGEAYRVNNYSTLYCLRNKTWTKISITVGVFLWAIQVYGSFYQ